MNRPPPALTAPSLARALCEGLAAHRDAVLQAPTGAGKSTLVPLALLAQPWLRERKILMLEPRRLAARTVAARMASLCGESVGQRIGYRMRLDTRVSRATRIEVVTEGVLTRLLQEDPALEGVGCVIFDEYHERSVQADLGLALCLDARSQLGLDVRLVIMSATLEGERAAQLLGDAAVVQVPGRAFAVHVHYLGRGLPLLPGAGLEGARDALALTQALVRAVQRALADTDGDVLVFLPGLAEIRRVEAALGAAALGTGVRCLMLFGQMSAEAQDAVLEPAARGMRKVVLATNIAETSLTIVGVTAVIDSGLVRRACFDPATGMSRLELQRISRAASEQRAGRAGRLAPGVCYRLWSEGAQRSLAATSVPEILEADLAGLALELARWGASDELRLAWLDAPSAPRLAQARELLGRLGAVDTHGRLTMLGQRMAQLPVHPRLAAMLLAARALSAVPLAAQLAALLSERDVLRQGVFGSDPDLHSRLAVLRGGVGHHGKEGIERGALEHVQRSARDLERSTLALPRPPLASNATGGAPRSIAGTEEPVGALLALAFPDRIGQRRDGAPGHYLLANGRGAGFVRSVSLARERFIVAAVLDDREREARIDLAAALPQSALEQLFAAQICSEHSFGWDAREGAVLERRVRRLEALMLEDRTLPAPSGEATVLAMLAGVAQLGIEALPWDGEARALQARMQFVRGLARGDLADWPPSDDATLAATAPQWLAPWLPGITRREHLVRLPLQEALRARLNAPQLRLLEALAPRTLRVPSGSQIQIDYLDDSAPCVAVRLQELFGLDTTPKIGAGAVALTFKLLSPAHRPVQITRDLAGFWRSSYAEVRKAMRGRYPKHAWPEDPLAASAARPARRRALER
jgi:ATP-dependent helicase HrpB